jgi:hypothetical protein
VPWVTLCRWVKTEPEEDSHFAARKAHLPLAPYPGLLLRLSGARARVDEVWVTAAGEVVVVLENGGGEMGPGWVPCGLDPWAAPEALLDAGPGRRGEPQQ